MRAGAVCAIVVAVLGHGFCGVARAQAPTIPLPSDLRVDLPAVDVPARVSRFAGAWAHGATITLTRATLAEVMAVPASVPGVVVGTTVRIPMAEPGPGGERLTLEATLYRPNVRRSRRNLVSRDWTREDEHQPTQQGSVSLSPRL